MLVRRTLRQEELDKQRDGRAQTMVVKVEGWTIIGVYTNPEPYTKVKCAQMIAEILVKCKLDEPLCRWLCVGDFHDTVETSLVADPLERAGGVHIPLDVQREGGRETPPSELASRWDGRECIDWLMSTKMEDVTEVHCATEKIGDHKGLIRKVATFAGHFPTEAGVLETSKAMDAMAHGEGGGHEGAEGIETCDGHETQGRGQGMALVSEVPWSRCSDQPWKGF